MKRVIIYLLSCVLAILATHPILANNTSKTEYSFLSASPDPCQQLTYRIGYIDPQIDKTEQELLQILENVELLWESALDQDLLEYSVNGKVAIHFVYNERHDISEQQTKFTQRIQRTKHRILGMRKEYNRVSTEYRKQKDLLMDKVSRLDSLHHISTDFKEKNNKGDNYQRSLSSSINSLGDSVFNLKSSVDRYRKEMKRKSKRIQSLIEQHQRIIHKYNRKFEANAQFRRGIYNEGWPDDRIYIFQFANRGELKAVLAHELGHAMGIGHVDNPNSIMYEVLEEQDIYDLSLTQEDKKAAKAICNN